MGIFSFFRKKKEERKPELPKETIPEIKPGEIEPKIETKPEEIKTLEARTNLLLTKFESLEAKQESISERLKNIERMLNELYQMAKS